MRVLFARRIGRTAYAPAVVAALASQHAAVALAHAAMGLRLPIGAQFWLTPLRTLVRAEALPVAALALAFGLSILASGLAATLSLWRARDAGKGHVAALLAMIPILQIPAILVLCALPSREGGRESKAGNGATHMADILGGVVGGMGLCVFAVAVSALVFGEYGWGLFALAPSLMGWVTAYTANRRVLLSSGDTFNLVLATACLGGFMLVLFALEGIICLLMAAPLAILCAWLGGVTGREMAIARGDKANPAAMSVVLLPLVFALEASAPSELTLTSRESVDIDAAPTQVWRAITANRDTMPRPALPFRLGLAYPLSAELHGAGVGAERIGRFSTGVARERVTDWIPGRRLGFEVLAMPPVMRELSPWRTVHAPHAVGYFQTARTSFDLRATASGGTRLTVSAAHTLRLDPAPYWEPMARWAIHANSRRVLAHLKARSEALARRTVALAPPSPRRDVEG